MVLYRIDLSKLDFFVWTQYHMFSNKMTNRTNPRRFLHKDISWLLIGYDLGNSFQNNVDFWTDYHHILQHIYSIVTIHSIDQDILALALDTWPSQQGSYLIPYTCPNFLILFLFQYHMWRYTHSRLTNRRDMNFHIVWSDF